MRTLKAVLGEGDIVEQEADDLRDAIRGNIAQDHGPDNEGHYDPNYLDGELEL